MPERKTVVANMIECTLTPKFHRNALRLSIDENVFEKDGEDFVSLILQRMIVSAGKLDFRDRGNYFICSQKRKSKCCLDKLS